MTINKGLIKKKYLAVVLKREQQFLGHFLALLRSEKRDKDELF